MEKIGSFSIEEYCDKVKSFHGNPAPGVIIGGFMVDLARKNLPEGILYDVICETVTCLPDAVQILTPCSVGNQWMKIIDVGRFAMTLYDKHTGEGIRVHLDQEKMENWPAIKEWFLKLKPKHQQDKRILFNQIKEAGACILGMQQVKISPEFLTKRASTPVAVCPVCNESYRSEDGALCPACKEQRLPYSVAAERLTTNR